MKLLIVYLVIFWLLWKFSWFIIESQNYKNEQRRKKMYPQAKKEQPKRPKFFN